MRIAKFDNVVKRLVIAINANNVKKKTPNVCTYLKKPMDNGCSQYMICEYYNTMKFGYHIRHIKRQHYIHIVDKNLSKRKLIYKTQ